MRSRGWRRRLPVGAIEGVAGLIAGAAVGTALLAGSGVALAHHLSSAGDADPGSLIEAAHVPPLLTAGERPVELRYDIECASPGFDPESGAPCDAGGTVYLRAGTAGSFRAVPLRLDPHAVEGRYVARVPDGVASSPQGFSYYAVVRNEQSGAQMTLPAGGAEAPQRSFPLGRAVTVSLGAHGFGHVRSPDARVAAAAWGSAADEVGLEDGPETTPIGATSFDVDSSGAVLVLDEAKKRVLRFLPGAGRPQAVPVAVNGTLADLAVARDGTMHVLESAGEGAAETPLVRRFAADGRSLGAWHAAERTVAAIREGPEGPMTLEYPSGQWMPAAHGGAPLSGRGQSVRGTPGRPVAGGGQVVVLRTGGEVRLALVGPNGVQRGWRISSETPLAEVQLAQPLGNRLVVVLRAYTDAQDEFVVLLLDGRGIASRFSVAAADWAEAAPLSRFRLAGSSLYRLGSTPAGMFVDRFDLGVSQ